MSRGEIVNTTSQQRANTLCWPSPLQVYYHTTRSHPDAEGNREPAESAGPSAAVEARFQHRAQEIDVVTGTSTVHMYNGKPVQIPLHLYRKLKSNFAI